MKKKREIPYEIEEILKSKHFWYNVVIDEFGKRIVGEIESREIVFMCAMGRLVKNCAYSSFNLLIHSESSAGKDYIIKNVLKIFPENAIFSRTRISPMVLNYWKPYLSCGLESWNGCILYLPDISESVLNSEAMKLLCSDGSHITITEKGEARDIEIKGKPVIFSTTATTSPNEEILNRFSIVHLDESKEQTKAIMKNQAKRISEGFNLEYNEKIKEALCYLQSYNVKIPFADKIIEYFPFERISERRNFERFFDFIKAITCFHQFQREKEGEDVLIAEIEDYDKARNIFMNIQRGTSSLPLNKRQKDIIKVLMKSEITLSLSEIHKKLENYITIQNLRPHLESLVNLKIIEKHFEEDVWKREIIKYKLSEEYINFKPIILPTGFDLEFNNNNKFNNNNNNNIDSNDSNGSIDNIGTIDSNDSNDSNYV